MKKHHSWIIAALVLSLATAALFVIPATLSFLFAKSATLVNTFMPSPSLSELEAAADISIQKTILSTGEATISPEGFLFQMEEVDGEASLTVSSDAAGKAAFHLEYDWKDAGQTFRYRITEVHDNRDRVIYSNASYLVEVTVSYLEDELSVSITVDGEPVTSCNLPFENTYDPLVPPHTGDDCPLTLYLLLLLLSSVSLLLLIRRRNARTV